MNEIYCNQDIVAASSTTRYNASDNFQTGFDTWTISRCETAAQSPLWCRIVTQACKKVFCASTMTATVLSCLWPLLNRRGLCIHAMLFAPLGVVSVLSCVEMKEVGRGKCYSTTSLRRFSTGSSKLYDLLQKGVFRFSPWSSSVVWLTCSLGVIFRWSYDRSSLTWPLLVKEKAAVVFR